MNSARTPRRPTPSAAETCKARKAEALALIERLKRQLNNIPEDSNWGHAGDAGHAVEQLTELVRSFETAYKG